MEQPGQKLPSRGPQASKPGLALANRPITVDDIKKAKLRASFMQSKYGKRALPSIGKKEMKNESEMSPSTSDTSNLPPVLKGELQPKVEEQKFGVVAPAKIPDKPDSPLEPKLDLSKPRLVECKSSMIPWKAPPGNSILIGSCIFHFNCLCIYGFVYVFLDIEILGRIEVTNCRSWNLNSL